MSSIRVTGLCVLALTAAAAGQTTDLKTPAELAKIAGWKGAAPNAGDAFRFIVMGDRTGMPVDGVWEKAVDQVNLLRPDFVMCIGDLVDGFAETEAEAAAEWKAFDAWTRKLAAPFFYVPGNHDVPNAMYRKLWANRDGLKRKLWYSFNYRGCHFVVFDSTAMFREIRGIGEEQWAWLKADLASPAARKAKHVFIFEHHPLFHDKGDWMRFRKLLTAGKTTIFCGHDHSLSWAVEHGVGVQMVGPTGGFHGDGPWERGKSHQFVHVTVSAGQPRMCVLPVGHVLPHDLRKRTAGARRRALTWGGEFSEITRAGGKLTFTLPNASDVAAAYTLTWIGPVEWFRGRRPKPETLTLAPGRSVTRTCKLTAPADPLTRPPAMRMTYVFKAGDATVTGTHAAALFLRPVLSARKVGGIVLDGKLSDWPPAASRMLGARWQIGDWPNTWTGLDDCSAALRVGYDDKRLYLAVDVTDDKLTIEGGPAWTLDGVEVFFDPRPAGRRGGAYDKSCRHVGLPLQVKDGPFTPAPGTRAACRRRPGGYVLELAVDLGAVAKGFKPAPGRMLRMDLLLNDRDDPDPKAKTTCLSPSGYTKSNYRTWRYAEVKFR